MATFEEVGRECNANYENNVNLAEYCFKLRREECEDLVSETILSALENHEKLDDIKNLKPWFWFMLRNKFINIYRRAVKYPVDRVVPIDFRIDDRAILGWEVMDYINNEMSAINISQEHKDCLMMFAEGYSYDDICKKHNIPMGSVKSRIHYTRKLLIDRRERQTTKY